MKAVLFHQHGGPEQLQLEEAFPDPVPGAREVVVQVQACALNHLDIWVLQGIPAFPVTFPHILGSDVAGVVHAVGPEVKGFQPGDRVLIYPGLTCGTCEYCHAGEENRCLSFGIIGARCHGGYAEKVTLPARNLIPIPASLSFEAAAAFPLTFLTAWHMLMTRARLVAGETCLIHAGGSGVGSAAIQIAKWRGAKVIATAGSDEKASHAKQLGADVVINYTQQDFLEVVKQETDGRGLHVVFEHVGPATWEKSVQALARGGRLVTCGATTGPQVTFDLRYLYSRELTVLGSMLGTKIELLEITKLVGEGRLKPVISQTFPLSEARAAHEVMHRRAHFGKLLLIP